jgi:hypothetical protein
VRVILSFLLVALLLACPQLCRAESLGCCNDRGAGTPDDSNTPEPTQNDAVSCICAGAIRDSGSQVELKTGLGDWNLDPFPPANISPSTWNLAAVVRGGAQPERPRCGPLRMHLMLQHLRC